MKMHPSASRRLVSATFAVATLILMLVATATTAAAAPDESSGPAAPDDPLEKLRSRYREELAKIQSAGSERTQAMNERYVRSLDTLERLMQNAGKLDELLILKKERSRFATDATPPDPADVAGAADLEMVRASFLKALGDSEQEQATAVLTLNAQYDRSLAALQDKLTKDGNYPGALAVRNVRSAAADSPELGAARFTIAEIEAAKAAEKTAGDSDAPSEEEDAPVSVPAGNAANANADEAAIKKRFIAFRDAVAAEDWNRALTFIHPESIRRRGADVVRLQLQFLMPMLQGTMRGGGVTPGTVTFMHNGTFARVTLLLSADGHEREGGRPTFWSKQDGEWFLMLKAMSHDSQRGADDTITRPRPPDGVRRPDWRRNQ